jgi:hypothetical protein
MKDAIEQTIEALAKRCEDRSLSSTEAMQYAQAALNLAHTWLSIQSR